MTYFAVQRDDNKEFYECKPFNCPRWSSGYALLSSDREYAEHIYNEVRKLEPLLKIHLVSFTMKVEVSS